MAETPNRELGHEDAAINAPSSPVVAKAAIRETRARLAVRLTATADRVHAIFTRPAVHRRSRMPEVSLVPRST